MSHVDYRFSVTIHTNDLAVVGCLRALAKYSQSHGNNNIPWGGTKDADWKRAGNKVTFRFSTHSYRDGFSAQVERLLPSDLVAVLATSDQDPATPKVRAGLAVYAIVKEKGPGVAARPFVRLRRWRQLAAICSFTQGWKRDSLL